MKLLKFILTLLVPTAAFGVTAGDIVFQQRNAGNTAWNTITVPTSTSQLLGQSAAGVLGPIILGTNLTMVGNTLNASGGGGGGGTPGGSVGQIQYNLDGTNFGGFTMSGDASMVVATGVITVSKIGGKAVTLAGALTTSGAFGITLTATNTTALTLPLAGTLATLAGSEAFTNKTYNGNTWTAGSGTLTLGAGKTATISNTLIFTGTDSSSVAFGAGGTVLYSGGSYVSSLAATANQTAVSAATGAVTVSLAGPHNFTTQTANNIITGNTTSALQSSGATITSSGNVLTFAGASNLTDSGTGSLGINVATGHSVNFNVNSVMIFQVNGTSPVVGATSTASTNNFLAINGSNASTFGPYLSYTDATGNIGYLGSSNPILSDSNRNMVLRGANKVVITTNGTSVAATFDTSQQAQFGTITAGTWNGSVIGPTYGGTGVNNASKTITLGGNLTTSGAFATTLTVTGATNVTLPTSGTLSTTTGTVTHNGNLASGFLVIGGSNGTTDVKTDSAITTDGAGNMSGIASLSVTTLSVSSGFTGTGNIVFATGPTITLANATGLPAAQLLAGALASGMTAATQAINDTSTKIATTAYVTPATTAMGALAIDWSTARTFTKTLATGSTFTFSNKVDGETIVVTVTNSGGAQTITWPTVKWSGGSVPTPSANVDVYTLIDVSGTVYGSAVLNAQ